MKLFNSDLFACFEAIKIIWVALLRDVSLCMLGWAERRNTNVETARAQKLTFSGCRFRRWLFNTFQIHYRTTKPRLIMNLENGFLLCILKRLLFNEIVYSLL